MEPVTLSPYIITLPSEFLAARPIVCTKDVSDLRNPSLSASSMATSEHSGISNPSLNKLIPIRTSKAPSLKSRKISIRSRVSMSECM